MPAMIMRKYKNRSSLDIKERALSLLEQMGLANRIKHFPSQLSGGELQRVALARALINDPDIILADEPTGNLDAKNGQKIIQVLRMLKANGRTVIVATHDPELIKLADRMICIEDGRLTSPNE